MSEKLDSNHQLEEMVQLLIRILGKTNQKIVELEERLKQLELEKEDEYRKIEKKTG
ncbi:hypothetical protein [Pallidibacillus pasinlerensis]|uniref:Uncharacterized protein n=1 Tax=Pallidibacillus pasinlerensis TaxID=2703818 RepID=A0ABX0A503_9BACI|nr:hypothetical protein [Pallidibacillus pasinlerensis]NCU16268.1 hypothetical protein [Pallidibacillus pasinlerensis]